MEKTSLKIKSVIMGLMLYSFTALSFIVVTNAHEGHHHHIDPLPPSTEVLRQATLKRIGEVYLSQVKPLFQKACFDCHSNTPRYPWYYKIPGARQLIDHDIVESKEHLDFSNDYPFKGHGTPEEDFKAIVDVMKDGSMPPFRYRILHSGQKLTDAEKKTILDWATKSAELLAKTTNQKMEPNK